MLDQANGQLRLHFDALAFGQLCLISGVNLDAKEYQA